MTQASDRATLKAAAVSVGVAALGAVVALVLRPDLPPATVLFFAGVAAIALFGAVKAVRVALAVFRQVSNR